MPLPPKPPALDVPGWADASASFTSEPTIPGAIVLSSDSEFWELHEEVRTLGKGSFGEVRLVRIRSTSALVAVKMVAKSSAPADECYGAVDARNEPKILMEVQRKFDSAPARIGGRRRQRLGMTPPPSLLELQDALRTPAADAAMPLPLWPAEDASGPIHRPPPGHRRTPSLGKDMDLAAGTRPQTLPGRRNTQKSKVRPSAMSLRELQEALGASGSSQEGDAAASTAEPEAAQQQQQQQQQGITLVGVVLSQGGGVAAASQSPAGSPVGEGGCGEGGEGGGSAEEGEEEGDGEGEDDSVRLLEVYDSPATLFMVMRAELGGDLESRLASLPGGVCGENEARVHASAILRALEQMHAEGVVHRDIKPSNVLLNEQRESRLGDFGLAARLPEDGAGLLTSVCGTHDCMAPEMVRCGHGEAAGYGREVDLWAVGLLLFTMLCGHHPFERSTEIATLTAILDADFVFPPGAAPSELAKDLIRSLLAPQPECRATAAEGLQHEWICADPTSPGPPPPAEREASASDLSIRQVSHLLRPSVVKSAMSIAGLGRQALGHT